MKKILKRIFKKSSKIQNNQEEIIEEDFNYYKLASDCQIHHLSKIYEQYFGKKNTGVFVEFGAYDGEYVSNTSGLADIGWKGLYMEPVPSYFESCIERHKNNNVKVLPYAVGAEEGKIDVHVGDALSTVSQNMKEHFLSIDWAKDCFKDTHTVTAKMTTLENILEEENIPEKFELLVVDVEGFEWDALRNFDIKKWQPKMVIIELHDQNDDYWNIRENCNNLINYFENSNYKIIYKDFTNTIYVKKDQFPIPIDQR